MKSADPTKQADFDSTDWSLLRRAADSPEALSTLVEAYWPTVYAYFRRCSLQPSDAADLTQGFFQTVVIGRNLPARAEASRGTFRALLRTALRNFRIDAARATKRAATSSGALTLDPHTLQRFEPEDNADPWDAFDRQWAALVLERAVERLREDCAGGGLETHWALFDRRILHPAIHATEAPDLRALADEHGLDGPEQASNMITVVKKRFRKVLLEIVGETTTSRAEAERELQRLWSTL